MKSMKKEYSVYAALFWFSSGFGWDPITKQFTAPDDVWAAYLMVTLFWLTSPNLDIFCHY